MALLFKSDVTYTGVAKAKHILELLATSQAKLDYVVSLLNSIKADTTYPTLANIDSIVSALLAHLNTVQTGGARMLSLPFTLKAIIFVIKNGLSNSSFVAVSPDFGVTYDAVNKYATKLFSLNGATFSVYSTPRMEVDKFETLNVLRQWDESASVCTMLADTGISLSNGLITGKCINQNGEVATAAENLLLRDMAAYNTIFLTKTALVRTASAASLTFYLPTTSPTAGASKAYGGFKKNTFKGAGVVSKYEYGTNLNKVFVNGAAVVTSTDANNMFNLSAYNARVEISSGKVTDGVVETWVINSKDETIANALSVHLNRQNMLII